MPSHTPEEQRKNAIAGLGQLGFTNPDEGEIQGFLASNSADSITGEALAPQPALNIQPTSQVPIPSVESLPITEPTAITPKEPDLIGDVEKLTRQLEGVDVEAGVVERTARERQDVINLQKQIKFFQAEALRSERLAAEQAETIGGASASVARARTENTARAMELAALAEAVGQNFALSETLARRAEETRFAQKEQDLETARQNLLANFEEFSPTEKRRAEQALARIGRDKEFLEEQKAERLGIQKVAIEAARSGITDSEVLQRIQSAPSLLEANRILAEVKPTALPQLKEEIVGGFRVLRDETGKVISTRALEEPGVPTGAEPKPAQRLAAGFAARLEESSNIITEIGGQFTGFPSRFVGLVPSGLRTADRQRFDQAKRNFVNAVLRRESGAAIAPSEFESADLQYFPQPGDKPEVIEQKRQNRELVTRSMQLEAGDAFAQLKGVDNLPPAQVDLSDLDFTF